MANKRKILENARKLAQRGSKARAMRQYKKLLRLDPQDAKLQLEIADAHRRWGQIKEALEIITALEPTPGGPFDHSTTIHIKPEVVVENIEGKQ